MTKTAAEGLDYLVFIGRFSPPHMGHFHVIEQALEQSKKVFLCIGSSNAAATVRNPFSFDQRVEMFKRSTPTIKVAIATGRIDFVPIDDMTYRDQEWIEQVYSKVKIFTEMHGSFDKPNIGLIGHNKDNSSYYLSLFPQWKQHIAVVPANSFNSTDLRNVLFQAPEDQFFNICTHYTTEEIYTFLSGYRETPDFLQIKSEFEWAKQYKQTWSNTPYPVIFQTVDTVVIQSGHILLVKRGQFPGKGLWAIPGGYVSPDETLEQAAIRELIEETRIGLLKLPKALKSAQEILNGNKPYNRLEELKQLLKSYIIKAETFDDPHRSIRGRVITRAFLIQLPNGPLPKVKGSDDAVGARWVPLADLNPKEMFEDHWHVIQKMTAGL